MSKVWLGRSGITYAIRRRVVRRRGKVMVWWLPPPRKLRWSDSYAIPLVMTTDQIERLRADPNWVAVGKEITLEEARELYPPKEIDQ